MDVKDDGLVLYGRHGLVTPETANCIARQIMSRIDAKHNWRNDPLYYAADRLKAKRRKNCPPSPLLSSRGEGGQP